MNSSGKKSYGGHAVDLAFMDLLCRAQTKSGLSERQFCLKIEVNQAWFSQLKKGVQIRGRRGGVMLWNAFKIARKAGFSLMEIQELADRYDSEMREYADPR